MKYIIPILLTLHIFTIGRSQNIGIGSISPEGKLQVNNNSLLRKTIVLLDSANNESGTIGFRSVNGSKSILIHGTGSGTWNSDMALRIETDSSVVAHFKGDGKAGINTANPTEALDVKGNINLTGTIKTNGSDGTPGQVLARGSGNQLQWQSLSGSSSTSKAVYTASGSGTVQHFTVPAGITQITVELWGGGGTGGATTGFTGILAIYGGGAAGGGGGGGYIKANIPVTPGQTINIVVGNGAFGSTLAEASTVQAGALTISALPGTNAQILSTGGPIPTNYFISGTGGLFSITDPAFRNFDFQKGADGDIPNYRAYSIQTGVFVDDYLWGKGGIAGNGPQSNGIGGQSVGLGLSYHYAQGTPGSIPGGGGGGDRNRINAGGNGLIIINY